ncbi:MAG: hypothetical protein KDE27_26030, partial [Planctomycetes bacterium]|nr:hypothetical protein [Planctomycetota bacterium]
MNTLQQRQEIDEIATCDPEVLGYGYSDSQHPWHHDPAIDHPRDAWLDFVDHLRATLPAAPTILQIGLGRRGGSHLALTTLGGRVVAVDGDAAAIARLGAAARFRGDPEDLVLGDGRDEATSTAVRARAPHFDCVVLDGDGTRAGMAAAWRRWAPLVRAGGVVAIVDRTQAVGVLAPRYRVDAFVAELARDRLEPCGVRMQRFGAAAAIHAYRQHERLCADSSDTPAAAADPEAPAVLGVGDGFARFTALGGCFAVAVDEAPYCPLRASRN